ncbi:MAG: protein kinase domain-containing protein [Phycisphaerae bacterium]
MPEPSLFQRAREIFNRVCEAPVDERARLLEEACRDDDELRREVQSLLDYDDSTGGDPANSSLGAGVRSAAQSLVEGMDQTASRILDRFGPYRIIGRIGEGGMGEVYEAEQDSPRRRVALKVIRTGSLSSRLIRRFEHEAFILGQLQHVGIAHIYESGVAEIDGRQQPFFAMELIEGERITVFARERSLSIRQRMELLARVCDAVQHAHQKGIIHRDIKPANILVVEQATGSQTLSSGSSHAVSGQPKVLDFGVARVTDSDVQTPTLQTHTGEIIGTLAYMSPEQVTGDSQALDTRCDVYALGVLLYQMLTDELPLDIANKSVPEAARIIRDEEPTLFVKTHTTVDADVRTIIAKAMEKDPDRRYDSAAQLAADIRRFLQDEPIVARPTSALYHLQKFASRNKGLVAGMITAVVMLFVALVGTGYGLFQAQSANTKLQSVVDYQSAMLEELDVSTMGRDIMATLREEARLNLGDGDETQLGQLASFEQVLSLVNESTVASRALDTSIMTRAVKALDTSFSEEPALQADLRASLIEIYINLGLTERALALARVESTARSALHGEDDPRTLLAERTVCRILSESKDFEAAEALARSLLETQKRVLGERHVETLLTLKLLGAALTQLDRNDLGQEELTAAIAGLEATVGVNHIYTLNAKNELAFYYRKKGRFDEALEIYLETLAAIERSLGPFHRDTLAAVSNTGQLYYAKSEFDKALPYLERAATVEAELFGDDHNRTIRARRDLSKCLSRMGELVRAEQIILDVLERSRRLYGPDHHETSAALSAGVLLSLQQKNWERAATYANEALAIALRSLGADHMRTLIARADLATIYKRAEKNDAALAAYDMALSEYRRVLGPEHRRTLGTQFSYAKMLMGIGQFERAHDELFEIISVCREKYPTYALHSGSLGAMVITLIELDKGDEAIPYADQLIQWCVDRSVPASVLGKCHLWLALAQFANENFELSRASVGEALRLLDGNTPTDHWIFLYAQLLQHVLDVRSGEAERSKVAAMTFASLRRVEDTMARVDRVVLVPAARRMLESVGIAIPVAVE